MAEIRKILFITLSNLGDVILTFPALDALREKFPQAKITCVVGPRCKEIFEKDPSLEALIVFDKHAKLREKLKLLLRLKKERFDIVIDFRNTLFQVLLPAPYKTSPFLYVPKRIRHMKERYLYMLKKALRSDLPSSVPSRSLYIGKEDEEYVENLLKEKGVSSSERLAVVSPATGGAARKWETEKFAQLCRLLNESYRVLLIGSKAHSSLTEYIAKQGQDKIVDLAGLTSLSELACLLKKSAVVISADTGTLQIASYYNVPIVALFGASEEARYGPWSKKYIVVKKDVFCRPCSDAQCRTHTLECMKRIKVEEVLAAVKDLLDPLRYEARAKDGQSRPAFKRILIVRTDRIGDVLLSTPVIKPLRFAYPSAFIAMMVSPYAREIVDGNPYLDEVIAYDKDGAHKSWAKSIKFALRLKRYKFDLAVVLHPTNRAHLIMFLASIPRRLGYNRKLGFLLTDRIPHEKQLGKKHEIEYNLDFIRYLDLDPLDMQLYMPLKAESELWASAFFNQQRITQREYVVALHPGASCPSKIWPQERFAALADRLVEKYGFRVVLVAGPKDIPLARAVQERARHPLINMAGKTSISQLASVLKRCRLFISNDSGPVHIASAVGTPVISIFGRKQKGLSPVRWGPAGKGNIVLHKEVGCIECLAHECRKVFACLAAITVEDVLEAVDTVLKEE